MCPNNSTNYAIRKSYRKTKIIREWELAATKKDRKIYTLIFN